MLQIAQSAKIVCLENLVQYCIPGYVIIPPNFQFQPRSQNLALLSTFFPFEFSLLTLPFKIIDFRIHHLRIQKTLLSMNAYNRHNINKLQQIIIDNYSTFYSIKFPCFFSPLFLAIFLPSSSEQPVVPPCWLCRCRANCIAWPSCDCPLLVCPAQSSPKWERGLSGTDQVSSSLEDHVGSQTDPPGERNLRENKTNRVISIIS